MIEVIGDRGKRRRYDPDLAEKINREFKEGKIKGAMKNSPNAAPAANASVDDICKGYEEFMKNENSSPYHPKNVAARFNATKEQILEFSKRLIQYKDLEEFLVHTAVYLTDLMHASQEEGFTIDLTELSKEGFRLWNIGYKLKNKKLTVYGSVGQGFGNQTEDSIIMVKGDAGNFVGVDAKNSEIYVKGNIVGLSDRIGKGTRVCKEKGLNWVKVYPQ